MNADVGMTSSSITGAAVTVGSRRGSLRTTSVSYAAGAGAGAVAVVCDAGLG